MVEYEFRNCAFVRPTGLRANNRYHSGVDKIQRAENSTARISPLLIQDRVRWLSILPVIVLLGAHVQRVFLSPG